MPTKVLVAYGTTNGSTARIAETIADVLRKRGACPPRRCPLTR
jgi:menaquinone-dependent protoporphyrinogen oxidase